VPAGIITSSSTEAVARFEALRKAAGPSSLAGKTLGTYVVAGLSEQSRNDLLSRLPVRQGEVLAEDSFDRIVKAVRDYDEHLSVGRTLSRSGDVTVTIIAPGADFRTNVSSTTVTPPPPPPDPNGAKRLTIGGNVQQAKLIRQPAPQYPPLAKQARISGVVHLQAVIGVDGNVRNLQVLSGHPLLIPPTLEAVTQWVYQKTLLNGEPVEVLTQIDVNFTLSDQQ
jgi:TonB family protein